MTPQRRIIYHVGMGKVASTFLQYQVFPHFRGIIYLQRTKYRRYPALLAAKPNTSFLLSREMDRQLEAEVAAFGKQYPETEAIILFRRHGSWIASQYRRWVKNGYPHGFEQFIDLENDRGLWKKEELLFLPKLEAIGQHFTKAPLVLWYDDLMAHPEAVIGRMADFAGATVDIDRLDLSPRHTSYNERQLLFIRKQNAAIYREEPFRFDNKVLRQMHRYLRQARMYSLLAVGNVVPPDAGDVLTDKGYIEAIDAHFAADWQAIQEWAAVHAAS